MEERRIEQKLREEVNGQRNICLRLMRKEDLDIDVTYGDIYGEIRTEQLNPAIEQGMEDGEQKEEEEGSTSEGQVKEGGLGT